MVTDKKRKLSDRQNNLQLPQSLNDHLYAHSRWPYLMEGSARIIIQEGGAPPPDPRILPLAPVRHAGDCHVDGGVILRGGGRPLKQAREASDTGAIRNRCITPFL